MVLPPPDLRRLLAVLDAPEARACGEIHLTALRARLSEATIGGDPSSPQIGHRAGPLGRVLPFGTTVLYVPSGSRPLRHRLLEVDRLGRVVVAIRRGPEAEFQGARVRNVDGAMLGVLPGGADHPLWGASDRILRLDEPGRPALLTVSGAVDWDALAVIPPLADPTRLPAGAGTSILNVLASLAADQGVGRLRYHGPYPSEQLFWALLEAFRVESPAPATDLVGAFTEGAEAQFATGEPREAPLDWTPAPHERLFLGDGPDAIYVQLRDGVEKLVWDGRAYYRTDWQGLRRREHRVLRRVESADGRIRFVASLEAFGRPFEDHLTVDTTGALVGWHPARPGADAGREAPLAAPWRAALAALLPLEATPLLATAIGAVWPAFTVVWGVVPRDLVETRGATVRLALVLARVYQTERVMLPAPARRRLAQRLVGEVLSLLGPPLRRAAATWLESEPAARQQAHLEAAAQSDRAAVARHAAEALAPLLAALEAGEALPS